MMCFSDLLCPAPQFRLPPPGVAIPAPRTSAAIAGNTPVVDTLVLTSVWAVQVLRALCQVGPIFGLLGALRECNTRLGISGNVIVHLGSYRALRL